MNRDESSGPKSQCTGLLSGEYVFGQTQDKDIKRWFFSELVKKVGVCLMEDRRTQR